MSLPDADPFRAYLYRLSTANPERFHNRESQDRRARVQIVAERGTRAQCRELVDSLAYTTLVCLRVYGPNPQVMRDLNEALWLLEAYPVDESYIDGDYPLTDDITRYGSVHQGRFTN